jgi:antitoxin component YwqK of YwqJK toxin-antitoxin module
LIHGTLVDYYPNGNMKRKLEFDMDDPSGEYLKFYKNGKPKLKARVNKGLEDGEWLYYDNQGKLQKRELYKNGNLIEVIEN